jgi:hypothetical protein
LAPALAPQPACAASLSCACSSCSRGSATRSRKGKRKKKRKMPIPWTNQRALSRQRARRKTAQLRSRLSWLSTPCSHRCSARARSRSPARPLLSGSLHALHLLQLLPFRRLRKMPGSRRFRRLLAAGTAVSRSAARLLHSKPHPHLRPHLPPRTTTRSKFSLKSPDEANHPSREPLDAPRPPFLVSILFHASTTAFHFMLRNLSLRRWASLHHPTCSLCVRSP